MNITLTQEQVRAITKDVDAQYQKLLESERKENTKRGAALAKKYERKLDAANQRASEWKHSYAETRKNLLAAQAEITMLKRRIRDGQREE